MNRTTLLTAAILGALAVALGAFGAHGLKRIATSDVVAIFETAVRYQVYHVFALLITGILRKEYNNRMIHYAGVFFILGIILFSGSLYALTALRVAGMEGLGSVGIVTPIGGFFFIAGWLSMCAGLLKK